MRYWLVILGTCLTLGPTLLRPASHAAGERVGQTGTNTDLRLLPVQGAVAHGWLQRTDVGVALEVRREDAGRVTVDEGCARPPQYYVRISLDVRNHTRRARTVNRTMIQVLDQSDEAWTIDDKGSAFQIRVPGAKTEEWPLQFSSPESQRPHILELVWQLNPDYPAHLVARWKVIPTGIAVCP
jgi:hypothetical protein